MTNSRIHVTILILWLVVTGLAAAIAYSISTHSHGDQSQTTNTDISVAPSEENTTAADPAPVAPQPPALPPLSFAEDRHDFGEILTNRQEVWKFKFVNKSDKRVRITRVKGTCNCSSLKIDGAVADNKEFFEAGEEGEIAVTVTSGPQTGEFAGSVKVFVDVDIEKPMLLAVSGEVILPYKVEPDIVDFGAVEAGKQYTRTIRITPVAGVSFGVTDINSPVKYLTAKVAGPAASEQAAGENNAKAVEIVVTFTGEAEPGDFSTTLTIHTDSRDFPYIQVSVRGKVSQNKPDQ